MKIIETIRLYKHNYHTAEGKTATGLLVLDYFVYIQVFLLFCILFINARNGLSVVSAFLKGEMKNPEKLDLLINAVEPLIIIFLIIVSFSLGLLWILGGGQKTKNVFGLLLKKTLQLTFEVLAALTVIGFFSHPTWTTAAPVLACLSGVLVAYSLCRSFTQTILTSILNDASALERYEKFFLPLHDTQAAYSIRLRGTRGSWTDMEIWQTKELKSNTP